MKKMKYYSSALRKSVMEWGNQLKEIDLLVGIPSFNNEESIRHVVEMVGEGLAEYYPDRKSAILVSDGGSLDDTREEAEAAKVPDQVARMVSIYRGIPGKGTSFRAVFEFAVLVKADACAVYDADLRSITPEWIKGLMNPMVEGKADFVAPFYTRHKYDGTITNHIVYPMTRALYGKDIRQPIGGDFGFSGELAAFYAKQDVWMTDIARFGIDIWMTTSAIAEGFRLMQANLGAKIHDPKDPAEDLGPMFQQVLSTMFYLMGTYEGKWRGPVKYSPVPIWNQLDQIPKIPPVAVTLSKMEKEFCEGFEQFRPLYGTVLASENMEALEAVYQKAKKEHVLAFDPELWAKILYDFAFIYQTWTRNRRRLVSIITPLYFGRVGAYCQQVAEMNEQEAEQVIQDQAKVFEAQKDYLLEKFEAWD